MRKNMMKTLREPSARAKLFFTVLICWLTIYADYFFGWWSQAISGLHLRENFLDLRIVLNFANCYKLDGTLVYQPLEGNLIECTGYQYGRTLLQILNLFRITENNATFLANIGILASLTIFTILFFTMGFSRPSHFALFFLVLAGAPYRLLLERGNFDILIFCILFFAMLIFAKDRRTVSFVLVSIASLIKFYTFGLLLLFPLFSKTRKEFYLQTIGVFGIGLLMYRDLRLIQVPFASTSYISFGAPWIGEWYKFSTEHQNFLRLNFSGNFWHIFGIILLIVITYFVNLVIRKGSSFQPSKLNYEANGLVVIFFGGTFLTCYCSGMNYDYRLFFLTLSVLATFRRIEFKGRKTSLILHCSLFLTIWCAFPVGIMKIPLLNHSAQALGNIGILFFTSVVLIDLLQILFSSPVIKKLGRSSNWFEVKQRLDSK